MPDLDVKEMARRVRDELDFKAALDLAKGLELGSVDEFVELVFPLRHIEPADYCVFDVITDAVQCQAKLAEIRKEKR